MMTTEVALAPHIYGASELGVLKVTAPGDAHPRVRYIGGELFAGLDEADGGWVAQGEAAGWERPFNDVLIASFAGAGAVPSPVEGVVVLDDEVLAAAILNEPARLADLDVKGTPVVWALARNVVVISGSDDERGIAAVIELAEQLYAAGGPVTSIHPIVVNGEEWAPYQWTAASDEQKPQVLRVIRLFGVRTYEAQAPAIKRPDVHVADPKIHVREDGVTVTFAAWPKGTATLLPVTDNVFVADPAGTLSVATFDQFMDSMGDQVLKTDLTPTRYYVKGNPLNAPT
jgi:hypothetical protein